MSDSYHPHNAQMPEEKADSNDELHLDGSSDTALDDSTTAGTTGRIAEPDAGMSVDDRLF